MIKLFKYLKSSIVSVVLIILLLFLQAWGDLSLPEYTSKIINVGVQQGGVESPAMNQVGEETLNKLSLFLSEKDSKFVNEQYKKDKNYKGEQIYKLKSNANKDKLSNILKKPMLILVYSKDKNASKSFNLPANMDIIKAFSLMPAQEKNMVLKQIDKQMDKYPDTITDQGAIEFVKTEYSRIGIDMESLQTNYILVAGFKMLVIAVLIMIDAVVVLYIGSRMAAKLARKVRREVFKKVTSYSKTEMKEFGTSSLITRTTNDVQQVQSIITFLMRVVFYAPIIAIGGLIKAYNTNVSMTYIIGIAVASIIALVIFLFLVAMPKIKKMQKIIDKLNLVIREILNGLPVVRAFSNENHEEERFERVNRHLTKTIRFVGRTMSFMMPAMMFIMNMICLLIVWKGATGVDEGIMQVGDIMAYIQYTMQIIMAFIMISMMSIMLPRASVSAKRINEVLDKKARIKEPNKDKEKIAKGKGLVEFNNVAFRYPDADYDVLTDISFTSIPGTTTAFIGSTGSGKSTVISLIPRFFDVTSGSIKIDGIDIRDMNTKDLRNKIGFVPQKGILFTGTIESNIKYGNDSISDKAMKKAAQVAQATEFIESQELGYKALITQGGTNVSGGQKQRLAIARAIAKNPDIFIFDDSFSALDFKTDASLRAELAKITKDKTVLIVAQRISTIMTADEIIVLDEGNIVGRGTHKELMKNCSVYKEIALSQLSEEELNYE